MARQCDATIDRHTKTKKGRARRSRGEEEGEEGEEKIVIEEEAEVDEG